LRPGDLRKVRERDIDIDHAVITIHYPTKSKNKIKTVRLLPEHVEEIPEMKHRFPALPELKFFRHHGGVRSQKPNTPFGPKYFKVWWDKACKKLGVQGLDLYGGTRHTSTTEIARAAGTASAREATAHETNKAFDRYCQFQNDTAFKMAGLLKKQKADTKILDFPQKAKND
jgi:integrase